MTSASIPPAAQEWALAQLGGRTLASARRMPGGTATDVYRLELEPHATGEQATNPAPLRAVLKLFTNAAMVQLEPETPLHEARMLECLSAGSVPAPRLLALDPTGAAAGVPAILMEWMSGAVELPLSPSRQWLVALAGPLAHVHRHECLNHAHKMREYEPWFDRAQLHPPSWTRQPAAWADALARLDDPPPNARRVLLHRDHHPTNVLWSSGHVVAVLDWANACLGPPAADYAHCRSNLVHLWGVEAADAFRDAAPDLAPEDLDPWWDIASLAEWLPGPDIYSGWTKLGATWLSPDLVAARLDEYVLSVVGRPRPR